MDEKQIALLCLAVSLIGLIGFVLTSGNEFEEKTISQMLSEENNNGIIFGKVDYVIKVSPGLFILNDGNKTTVFYPKAITFGKDSFVRVYGTSQLYNGEMEIVAQRIEVEK